MKCSMAKWQEQLEQLEAREVAPVLLMVAGLIPPRALPHHQR
jgi:hypothetical protein